VWEAVSTETERRVALKILTGIGSLTDESVSRFRREGRLAASLSHPRCVFIYRAEEAEGLPLIAMELMEGGTLQDLLREKGPLHYTEAVDHILDILEGLEAAHALGILHRDLKPSNCFLDADGRAKIGDFGLSRTLEGDASLTATGSYLGTPHFSSPEQVRGRDVDFRSDLYSLGATLYMLLTGHPPFEAAQAGEVLARILSEAPARPTSYPVQVPAGLERVVMKLLTRDPRKRFSSHAALRSALLPFSSQSLTAAGIGKRAVALGIDLLLQSALVLPPIIAVTGWAFGSPLRLEATLLSLGLDVLYFSFTEWFWGRSPGKFLMGLRVTAASGGPAGAGGIALRSFLFVGMCYLPPSLIHAVLPPSVFAVPSSAVLVIISYWLGYLIMASTMRRRNGYAGVHEILSRTRVVEPPLGEKSIVPDDGDRRLLPLPDAPAAFGPFRPLGMIWADEKESLLVARDEALGRRIWIHRYSEDPAGRPPEKLAALRPGRLWWLQGSREPGQAWDAYEAPSGTSLVDWVLAHGTITWADLRGILLGMAEEVSAGGRAGDLPREVDLSHVWMDRRGCVKLLGFPAMSATEAGVDQPLRPEDPELFRKLALYGLTGARSAESAVGRPPGVPVPEHAREFLGRLFSQDAAFTRPEEVREALKPLILKPGKVTKLRRLLALAPVLVPGLFQGMALFILFAGNMWMLDLSRTGAYQKRLEELNNGAQQASAQEADAIRTVLAAAYQEASAQPLGQSRLASMTSREIEFLKTNASRHSRITPEEKREAQSKLLPKFRQDRMSLFNILLTFVFVTLFLGVPAVLLAFVLRGSLLLKIFGIEVQTAHGARAGRLRCLARSAVAWSPALILLGLWLIGVKPARPEILFPAGLLVLVGAAIAIAIPERGLAERVSGTHLVPR
jgi:uncharacterized RDD family membrane protein YckC